MINTPLNPIGRVFDAEEMEAIARALRESNAYAICDEVYEHLTYDGRPHVPLATFRACASGGRVSRRERYSRSQAGRSAG